MKIVQDLIEELQKIDPKAPLFCPEVIALFEQVTIDILMDMNDPSKPIETADYNEDVPLPLIADLEDPTPYKKT